MKTILLIFLMPLSAIAQTTYPVLSTTTARTIVGGVTNLPHLNSNNVFTATNTFTASKFFPANKVFERLLFSTGGIFIASVSTNTGSSVTNAGSYALHSPSQLFEVTLPPLLSARSVLVFDYCFDRTNAAASGCSMEAYVGSNTNYLGSRPVYSSGTLDQRALEGNLFFFGNGGSYTQQYAGNWTVVYPAAGLSAATNFCDTSSDWKIYLSLVTSGDCTNVNLIMFSLTERVLP